MRTLAAFLVLQACSLLLLGQTQETLPPGQSEEKPQQEKPVEEGPTSYVLVEEKSVDPFPSRDVASTKYPASVELTPLSINVVTRGLFDSQGAHVLGEALSNVSGAVAHTGFGVFDYFVIRGFDSLSNGLVLTDGAPEPEATFYHLYNVDRVEVMKGPGAFLYGGNPLSGFVNLVRKEPILENLIHVGGSFGSFGTARGNLDFNRANSKGNLAFRLNAFGNRSNHYRDGQDNWQAGINPALRLQLGEKSTLNLNFEHVSNRYASDSGIPLLNNQIPDVPRSRSYQSPFDSTEQNIWRTRIDFTSELNDSVVFRNKFYYTDLSWVSDGTILPVVLPDSGTVFRNLLRLDDRQKMAGNQSELLISFSSATIEHSLLAGFEWSRLGDQYTLDVAQLPPIGLFDPVETAAQPLFNIPFLAQSADARNMVFAPYIADQITFSDRLRILLGGRFDAVDFEDQNSGSSRESRKFSPVLGVSYSVQPGFSLYSNFSRAFAPPSTQIIGEREPEESAQFELGAKRRSSDGQTLLTLALFHLEKDNIAIPDQTGITKQSGSQRSRGIEFDLAHEFDSRLFLSTSYAFVDAELTEFRELVDFSFGQLPPVLIDRSGNHPAFAPRHIFSLWMIKELGNGFSLAGGGRYLSRQFIAENNQFAIDETFLLNAAATYQRDDWRVSLNFKNLAGSDYETRGFGSTSVIPGQPFAVYLTIDLISRSSPTEYSQP